MAIIKAFKGVRPLGKTANKVASRPYDVMNVAEARAEVADNDISFLRVTRSEVELHEGVDVHSQLVYDTAAAKYVNFKQDGTLIQDENPCLYLYQQTMFGLTQTGLLCVSSLDDYNNNIIKKHEFTRPEKELDRTLHIKTVAAQTGKVFMTYKGVKSINQIIEDYIKNNAPEADFIAEDGVSHVLWAISNTEIIHVLTTAFANEVPATYIADGHHRAASANNARTDMMAANPSHTGDEAYNYFITVLFPAEQLQIIDYNRVVKDLNGLSVDDFIDKLKISFEIELAESQVKPTQLHDFGMYINQTWYRLKAKPGTYTNDPIGILDVSILQNNVLSAILEIHDPRVDTRVEFVGGIRGLGELEKRVNSGEMAAAFSMYAVSLTQLIDIADSGQVMPPKSTWFEPKLRDGLVVYEL
jgi:uncharacterized protein (DUF1015 family)